MEGNFRGSWDACIRTLKAVLERPEPESECICGYDARANEREANLNCRVHYTQPEPAPQGEALVIPEDLQVKCPLCAGEGMKNRTSFSDLSKMRMGSCHSCKGTGKIWALDQQEMAERIARAEADARTLKAQIEQLEASHEAGYMLAYSQVMKIEELREQLERMRTALEHYGNKNGCSGDQCCVAHLALRELTNTAPKEGTNAGN